MILLDFGGKKRQLIIIMNSSIVLIKK